MTGWISPPRSAPSRGDDTVLIVMRENESAAEFCSEIEDMQRQRQTK